MNTRVIVATLAALMAPHAASLVPEPAMLATARQRIAPAREDRIPVGKTTLYAREIGQGRPVIVLHGGPDFDHRYLLPDLDRLADTFRLIYYDQRGRGRSADGVRAEDVTLASEIDDLDAVIRHYRLESPVLLGHSWVHGGRSSRSSTRFAAPAACRISF
jgi:proline iminopeptidase